MGITKSEKFTEEQNQIATIAKAFAHPARVAILQQLFKMNACICGDLVAEIGLAQPTISQHLKELKNLGLIKGNVEGTSVCYCINEEVWETSKELFTTFLNQDINPKSQCC
ncbi:MAG: transcriptional regulator [Flavobacteria bacterium RIFCSPLOWO2_12_FULL_35_11]|nr:MAG: transcriptional regulator [Flavobacteria bacterium RIFCSPLOWO2_12_FULL_35_11]